MAPVFRFPPRFRALHSWLIAVAALTAWTLAAAANQKTRLVPKFIPGETLHYQIESHTATTVKTTTPIKDPEGGSRSAQTIDLLVRLDVLSPAPDAVPSPASGATRFRVTFEKSHAEAESDAFDPTGPSLEDQYTRIEGRSFDFTLDPGGSITNLKGLDDLFPDRSAAAPAFSWIDELFPGSRFPRDGISVGQKWKSEHPVSGMPLDDLNWLSQSTYLHDEACNSSADAGAGPMAEQPASPAAACATILTRYEMSRRGSPHSDATPPDYRRNGLRTSGAWTGFGDSLDSISLATGLLVSSTQNSTQDMDYEIASASTGSSIHRKGRVQSQSIITLVPDSH